MSKKKLKNKLDLNMTKRNLDEFLEVKEAFKHSLDSDEEDDEAQEENYDVMNENDIEGVEDGPSAIETNIGFTAFNMKEELEEGHFDKEGHYHWKKEKEIRDNWLDNIDWVKVKSQEDGKGSKDKDSDDSDEDDGFMFDPTNLYKQILEYLKPGENVSRALIRLGKGTKKLTTIEKWKRKKDPNAVKEDSESSTNITKLTELANELLTQTGNMDIYQETYEQIQKKISLAEKHSTKVEAELDMFSDDFDSKEKSKKKEEKPEEGSTSKNTEDESAKDEVLDSEVTWELKWSQDEKADVHGPHTSQQMHEWSKEGYFKNGAWVRKKGQPGDFYNASRIDFELYL